MDELPEEILIDIFKRLEEGGDLARLASVHSFWARTISKDCLWEYFCKKELIPVDHNKIVEIGWYQYYRGRYKRFYHKETIDKHSSAKSCWIVVEGAVLDVTNFLLDHPGGSQVILQSAGRDPAFTSALFRDVGHSTYAEKLALNYRIGRYKEPKNHVEDLAELTPFELPHDRIPFTQRGWFILFKNASVIYIVAKLIGLVWPDTWWPWGTFSLQAFLVSYFFGL